MTKILKNRSGITLIELVVAMLIFSILATSVSAVLAPLLKVYIQANELAECNTLLDNIANQIIDDLYNATSIPTCDGDQTGGEDKIEFSTGDYYIKYTIAPDADANEGALLKSSDPAQNGRPVLAKNYYKNKSVHFLWSLATSLSEPAYTLTVIVSSDKDNREMMRREYAVRPPVLNQY